MGKYGYKFIGTDGFAAQYTEGNKNSLSSERNQSSESIDTVRDGRPPMSDNSGQHPKKVSSTESNIADCLSKLVIALAKHRNKYIGKDSK